MTSNSLIRKKSIIDALISFVEAPIIFILFFIFNNGNIIMFCLLAYTFCFFTFILQIVLNRQ